MFTLLIKTKTWINDFAKEELNTFLKQVNIKKNTTLNTIEQGLYEIVFANKNDLTLFVMDLVYYSRTIENIYLKILEFNNIEKVEFTNKDLNFIVNDFTFAVDCDKNYKYDHNMSKNTFGTLIKDNSQFLQVNLSMPNLTFILLSSKENDAKMNYLALDLIGFKLTKRDYKLNRNSNSINSLIVIYGLYLLKINKITGQSFSMIDPYASIGDVIIESSLFNPRAPLNVKKINQIPLFKLFQLTRNLPKTIKHKNKFIGIVQNNKIFKYLRENINFSSQKIKVSQYELDWLDVKFNDKSIDYVICQFPSFKEKSEFEEFQKDFFYQTEFIFKKKICVISKKKITKKHISKNNLNINFEDKIKVGEQEYCIYIFSSFLQ